MSYGGNDRRNEPRSSDTLTNQAFAATLFTPEVKAAYEAKLAESEV